ncbi:MAG: class I SAM-dependent methyltransferase [Acidobacteriia bacterium]|nr:class I SAM-dependent methyltransferase [Terriglobia bacterium]
MAFTNCYADAARAEAYARLEFANTYYLAYRDLPEIIREHVSGRSTLDFGCGAGRSTRFARRLGLDMTGVDIAPEMINKARELDPAGDYRLVNDDDFSKFGADIYDLVLSLFTFDNIPGFEMKKRLFRDLGGLLKPSGKMISVVSSPEIYLHEWASFSTKDYPENREAQSGDVVRIITTDSPDRRPAEDILCTDETYRDLYGQAGLNLLTTYKPLAHGDEPYPWINETKIAPWVIYVLARKNSN